jgi:serine/threonine-protein kinase
MSSLARGTPRQLADAIDKCLAKAPADRFATGEALADALASSLVKRADMPVPLRVFTDRRRQAALIAPVAMSATIGLGILGRAGGGAWGTFLLLAGVVALPMLITLNRLRGLARHGYGPEDTASALRAKYERQREEFLFEFGQTQGVREKIITYGGHIAAFAGMASAVLLATGAVLADTAGFKGFGGLMAHWRPFLLPVTIVTLYVGIIATVFAGRWRNLRLGLGPRMGKFWGSRVGKWFGRVAATKLGERAIPADRPTELKIALNAESLFESLPKPVRESLGDVPGVLKTLQERAHSAREQIDKLDAVLAGNIGVPGRVDEKRDALTADVKVARKAAETRLSELVTAMETVRLDLLRLQAGVGKPESITQDLAAAAAVGQDADRLIAALSETDAVILRERSDRRI